MDKMDIINVQKKARGEKQKGFNFVSKRKKSYEGSETNDNLSITEDFSLTTAG